MTTRFALLLAFLAIAVAGCGSGGEGLPAAERDAGQSSGSPAAPGSAPQRATHLDRQYEVVVDDGVDDVAFAIADTCEGVPYRDMTRDCVFRTGNPLLVGVRHWVIAGQDYGTLHVQPGQRCVSPDRRDGTFGASPDNRDIALMVAVRHGAPAGRLRMTIGWEGRNDRCERRSGTLEFDAAVAE